MDSRLLKGLNEVRPDVMVDLDGCAAIFYDAFLAWAMERDESVHHLDDIDWYFYRQWGWDDQRFVSMLNLFSEDGMFGDLDLYPGTVEAWEVLPTIANVHVVTDKPDSAWHDTAYWLNSNGLHYDSLTFSRDKTAFKQFGPGPYLAIDDRVENVQAMRDAGIDAYLMDRPWNSHSHLPRVTSLAAFVQKVMAYVDMSDEDEVDYNYEELSDY